MVLAAVRRQSMGMHQVRNVLNWADILRRSTAVGAGGALVLTASLAMAQQAPATVLPAPIAPVAAVEPAAPPAPAPAAAPPAPPPAAPQAYPAPPPASTTPAPPAVAPAPAPVAPAPVAPAQAQLPQAAPAPAATAPALDQAPPSHERAPIDEHTGFYFQAALGVGGVSIEDDYEGESVGTETVKGAGTLLSLCFGGGVGAGFVLGGGVESISGSFDYEDDWGGGTTEAEVDATGNTLFAMAQKYLGPVFLRAELGGMWGGAEDEDVDYGGFMIAGGLGADFLVSESWSLGGVAGVRRTTGSYSDEDGYSGDFTMTVTSLQLSGTYF